MKTNISIKSLAESIDEKGLISPLGVCREDDSYRIVYGERRLQALRYLDRRNAECFIIDYKPKSVDSVILSLIENIQRRELTTIERARICYQLYKRGVSIKELEKLVGCKPTTLLKYNRVMEKIGKNPTLENNLIAYGFHRFYAKYCSTDPLSKIRRIYSSTKILKDIEQLNRYLSEGKYFQCTLWIDKTSTRSRIRGAIINKSDSVCSEELVYFNSVTHLNDQLKLLIEKH